MDFFETREKYRRREVHIYMRWLSRIFPWARFVDGLAVGLA